MDRRRFLRHAGDVLWLSTIPALAQQPAPLPRIGVVTRTEENVEALVAALAARGYVDGRTMVVERRRSGAEFFSSSELARITLVVVGGPYSIALALKASKSTPIVAVDLERDPVASGFAQSLARPGGQITGVFLDLPELGAKQIQLLREIAPSTRLVGILWDEGVGRPQYDATVRGALAASLRPVSLPFPNPANAAIVAAAFDRARAERVDGLVILTALSITPQLSQIAELALKNRLPTISPFNRFSQAGAPSLTVLICPICIGSLQTMSTESSRERSQATFQFNAHRGSFSPSM